jgi:hypothetical protein
MCQIYVLQQEPKPRWPYNTFFALLAIPNNGNTQIQHPKSLDYAQVLQMKLILSILMIVESIFLENVVTFVLAAIRFVLLLTSTLLLSFSIQAIPSIQYSSEPIERMNLFFNDPTGGIPPYFEDFTVEICDPDDNDCMSNCYQIDSGHTVKLSLSILVLSISIPLISFFLL